MDEAFKALIFKQAVKVELAKTKVPELLAILEEYGSCYPSEILGGFGLTTPDTRTLINYALQIGVIKKLEDGRIAPSDYGSDDWFKRIMQQSNT